MVTLTYPGDWRPVCPNGGVLQAQFRAFRERWSRQWGERMRGVWVREFQSRGAPHLHMYVGLPERLGEGEYELLVRRRLAMREMERAGVAKYQIRRSAPIVSGVFMRWIRSAWSDVCGTAGTEHSRRGADVVPMFWGATVGEAAAGRVDFGKLGEYLWSESGKWGQKTPPAGFVPVGRAWGVMGVDLAADEWKLPPVVFFELRRALRAYLRSKGVRRMRARGRDGVTVFGMPAGDAERLRMWAYEVAAWKFFGPESRGR